MNAALAAALVTVPAHAMMSKDQCVDANTEGQNLRLDKRFAAARERLTACSDPACPTLIREDCSKRLRDLEHAQPTIVFDVDGAEPVSVRVTVDGQPLTDRLEGSALRVDPGEHTFVFSAEGRDPSTLQLSIQEGQKDRHEPVTLKVAALPSPPPVVAVPFVAPPPMSSSHLATTEIPSPRVDSAPPSTLGWGSRRMVGLATGGVGVVGLAVGSVFGALTLLAVSRQNSDCPSGLSCPMRMGADSAHSTAFTEGTVADVALIAGGTLLALGAALFFSTSPPPKTAVSASTQPTKRWGFRPSVRGTGGGLVWSGEL
jgi:hypothetical protein